MASLVYFVVLLLTILIMFEFNDHTLALAESMDDRSALVAIKNQIVIGSGSSNAVLNNWTQGTSLCNWLGVTCGPRHSRVTSLRLSSMDLGGTIAREIGNLSFLVSLDITNNSLQGTIPDEIGNLRRLANLSLGYNELEGFIPPGFGTLIRLQVLNLSHNHLTGTIPISIFNISSLITLDLSNNTLRGAVPRDICDGLPMVQGLLLYENQLGELLPSLHKCTQARYIALSNNEFTGNIPRGIGNLTTLVELSLGYNYLTGNLPEDIGGKAMSLRILMLENNQLVGSIPASLGNLTKLEMMYIGNNNYQGTNIPIELGHLTNLEDLSISFANLSGEIPSSIFNISTLHSLTLVNNSLTGNLPFDIGLRMPNLQYLLLGINKLTGSVPMSISNATSLMELDCSSNLLTGQVPLTIGNNLPHLVCLNLEENRLSNSPELDFLNSLINCPKLERLQLAGNLFNGVLPRTIGNLSSTLQTFRAGGCDLKGEIPSEIGNLTGLIQLELSRNELTGQLPSSLGNMRSLQHLRIPGNLLQGGIPSTLCNLQYLSMLGLRSNKFSGEFPNCLGNISSLRELHMDSNELTSASLFTFWNNKDLSIVDLSNNLFTGNLSQEIGSIRGLRELNLSSNNFRGEIPASIGDLPNLVRLSLSMNQLSGPIPETFRNLVSMEYLDLSRNNISGAIPMSLAELSYLSYLNLSFNELSGEIPYAGPFQNFSFESFIDNNGLCGSPQFHVMACNRSSTRTRMSRKTRLILEYVLPSFATVVLLAAVIFMLVGKYRKKGKNVEDGGEDLELAHRYSFREILSATCNFDGANMVGKGGSSSVYMGEFSNGVTAAVKRYNLDLKETLKGFDRECEVMRNTRHRNLVKVIGSCSNMDLKAIVMEFMVNGSLESWLYSEKNNCLDMAQRLGTLVDVASALEYLHDGYSIPIVHCDVKPNNILFDDDMVAHLGDFGIARLLGDDMAMVQTKTLGTVGYMAPEYGSAGIVSTMVDVYSFGVLIMEIVTRKKPTSESFIGEFTMKKWVSDSLVQNKIMEIVDDNLLAMIDEGKLAAHETCLETLLKLAMECVEHDPQNRISINNVLPRLNKMRAQFLRL